MERWCFPVGREWSGGFDVTTSVQETAVENQLNPFTPTVPSPILIKFPKLQHSKVLLNSFPMNGRRVLSIES